MPTFKTILTDIGLAKISNAVALGQTINLTQMAIGDGGGDSVEPKQTQVNLVNELYRAQLNRLDVDSDNPNYIISELVVPANVGGWTVREVGILDEENDLIAVANFPETYKPQLSEGSSRDLVIRVYIEVVNTEVVELKVDPSVVLASRQWVVDNFISGLGGTLEGAISKTVTAKPQRIGNLPVVSFVFDDGYESHYNDVAPLFESKGFRCGFAINSKLQEAEATRSTIEQMLHLQSRGFEIMNHGATHADLRSNSALPSLATSEINNGFDDLTAMGFDVQSYVASFSSIHSDFLPLVKERHSLAFTKSKTVNTPVDALQDEALDTFTLHRANLNSLGVQGSIDAIDAAIEKKSALVFYDHDPSQDHYPSSMNLADLTQVLDYCVTQGIRVELPRDAIDLLHNSTIKARRIELANLFGNRGALFGPDNLLPDPSFQSVNLIDNAQGYFWYIDGRTLTGTFTATKETHQLTSEVEITMNSDNVAESGSADFKNEKLRLDTLGVKQGRLCYSAWLASPDSNINDNYDVEIGVQIRDLSTYAVISQSISEKLHLSNSPRRYHVSVTPEDYSKNHYVNCYVRVTPKVSGVPGRVRVLNPMVNHGNQPAQFKRTIPQIAGISGLLDDSSAGGVVMEKGSNANGDYIRFESGLQICTRLESLAWGTTQESFNYAASFVTTPYVNGTVVFNDSQSEVEDANDLAVRPTSVNWVVRTATRTFPSAKSLFLIAIGWWK